MVVVGCVCILLFLFQIDFKVTIVIAISSTEFSRTASKTLNHEGVQLFLEGDSELALGLFTNASKVDPLNEAVLRNLAWTIGTINESRVQSKQFYQAVESILIFRLLASLHGKLLPVESPFIQMSKKLNATTMASAWSSPMVFEYACPAHPLLEVGMYYHYYSTSLVRVTVLLDAPCLPEGYVQAAAPGIVC